MLHERFDLEKFKAIFPLTALREEAKAFVLARQQKDPTKYPTAQAVTDHIRLMEPHSAQVTGPYHMTVIEQLREEALEGGPLPERMETDVFVFGLGEPNDRRCTKIGGIPYWPKRLDWPVDRSGAALQFVAQFNFADSLSLVGDLPGDLLVIFGDPAERSAESLRCYWVNSREEAPIETAAAPEMPKPLTPLYGVLHRTYDCATKVDLLWTYRGRSQLCLIEGTKIGGMPTWIQREDAQSGKFLCTLGSILPRGKSAYPYVNVERPLGFREVHNPGMLMWGDVGSVYFFLGEDGSVRWTEQCH